MVETPPTPAPEPNRTPVCAASIVELVDELKGRVHSAVIVLIYADEEDYRHDSGSIMMDAKGNPQEVRGVMEIAADYFRTTTRVQMLGRDYGRPEDGQDGEEWKRRGA